MVCGTGHATRYGMMLNTANITVAPPNSRIPLDHKYPDIKIPKKEARPMETINKKTCRVENPERLKSKLILM